MATPQEIRIIADSVEQFLRKIIGMNFPLLNSRVPAVAGPPYHIGLPLSWKPLTYFFGKTFVQKASKELIFSVLVGLAYHEVAHIVSGEDKHFTPWLICNLINDSNDFNVVPRRWPGSIPFTHILTETVYTNPIEVCDSSREATYDFLEYILLASEQYLRRLRMFHAGQWRRHLPQDHILHECMEEVIPILRETRRSPIYDRARLMQAYYDIVRKHTLDFARKLLGRNLPPQEEQDFFDHLIEEAEQKIDKQHRTLEGHLSEETIKQLDEMIDSTSLRDKIDDILGELKVEIANQDGDDSEEDKGGWESKFLGHSHTNNPQNTILAPKTGTRAIRTDDRLVIQVRRILKPRLVKRMLSRRAPEVIGVGFAPSFFYEIKTDPEHARIRQEIKRIGRALPETAIALLCDHSGSMNRGHKQQIANEIMATLYKALLFLPRIRVGLFGFFHATTQLASFFEYNLDTVLRRIPETLRPTGGTNLPWSLHLVLDRVRFIPAYRKIIVVVTDGDLKGTVPIEEQVAQAKDDDVHLIVLGIAGAKLGDIKAVFGENSFYVPTIADLPEQLIQVVLTYT